MTSHRGRHTGFTLIEIMIVISIIVFLVGLTLFPYAHYMRRAYVESTRDILSQDWILSHKDIRNGKLYDDMSHANMLLIIKKGAPMIERYLFTGSILQVDNQIAWKKMLPLTFESDIVILDITGFDITNESSPIYYAIYAPHAKGEFYYPDGQVVSSTGIFLTLGYTGSNISKQILLRPYLD